MNPGLPTKEELELMREHIFLPLMMDIAAKNRDEIDRQRITFTPYLVKAMELVIDRMHKRLAEVNKLLKQAQIKVWEAGQRGDILDYKYICRGYTGDFPIWREHMKSELRVRFDVYMRETL